MRPSTSRILSEMAEQPIDIAITGVSSRILRTSVAPELLRAVSAKRLCERFGYHMKSGYYHFEDDLDDRYEETHQVLRYDHFISHDWGSGRFDKYLALCAYYNLLPAVLVSSVFSLGVMILEILKVLPLWGTDILIVGNHEFRGSIGRWSEFTSPVIYVLTLFYWQNIRQALRLGSANVFFDRLCVHQTNEALKTAGIMGIGGFIEQSDKLLILWSPRYFTRLWCVYEVAAFTYLGKLDSNLIFIPIEALKCVFAGQCLSYVAALLSAVPFLPAWGYAILFAFMILLLLIAIRASCRLIQEALHIQYQLACFRMSSAACFCCSVNHKDNGSGRELLCDRKLIYKTIGTWFTTDTVTSIEASPGLVGFESYVKGPLAAKLISRLNCRWSALMAVAILTYPYFWYTCDQLTFTLMLARHPQRWRMFVHWFAHLFVYVPLAIRFIFLSGRWMAEEMPSQSRCLRYSRRAGIFLLTSVVSCVAVMFPVYARQAFESAIPQLVALGCLAIVLVLLFRTAVLVVGASNQGTVGGFSRQEDSIGNLCSASEAVIVGNHSHPNADEPDRVASQGKAITLFVL